MRLPAKSLTLPVILIVLSACAADETKEVQSAPQPFGVGPAADYPITLGDPYSVDGTDYEPADRLNYDAVGSVSVDLEEAAGVFAAHKTLPLPSYVEVTSLDTGRTILVRVVRRGPMVNERVLALSADAAEQLDAVEGAPVRVRRVLPPEVERAELRAGRAAPLRMNTTQGLLKVLRQRLEGDALPVADPGPPGHQQHDLQTGPVMESPDVGKTSAPKNTGYYVQLGAFLVKANATTLAEKVGGFTVESGQLTLVRSGPYSSRGQANAALAKLREQGYTDALVGNSD